MSIEVRTAIFNRLQTDGTLTGLLGGTFIYDGKAPQSHDLNQPWVVYFKSVGDPAYGFAGKVGGRRADEGRAFMSELWGVKAIERNYTSSRVESIATRLDQLLTGSISIGGTAGEMWRELDIDFIEVADD